MYSINDQQKSQRKAIGRAVPCLASVLCWALSLMPMLAWADSDAPSIMPSQPTSDHIVLLAVQQLSLVNRAKMWGLTPDEFTRYRWLMKNTPSGHWYRRLDPAEVLALNANNPVEMIRYATIQAHRMHERVTRELAFNKLYTEAYRRLYPTETAIQPSPVAGLAGAALQAGDRVWLFVGLQTPLGELMYRRLLQAVQATPNTVLDIYFVGKAVSEKSIQAWAAAMGIPRTLINSQVTLNEGNDRFRAITQAVENGKRVNLPWVGVVHNGRLQPLTVSSR